MGEGATERAEAVQAEEPLAQVVAGAGPPGVVWVAEVPWPPVVGAKAAWQPKLVWTQPSRLGGR